MMTFDFKNIREFMDDLNREIRKLEGRTHRGLIEAAIILGREVEPETPVDFGNLRSSWFIVSMEGTEQSSPSFKGPSSSELKSSHTVVLTKAKSLAKALGSNSRPFVLFGYTANYAAFVHEHVGANFKRPGARARWLLAGMLRAKKKMLAAIQLHARF